MSGHLHGPAALPPGKAPRCCVIGRQGGPHVRSEYKAVAVTVHFGIKESI